MDEKTLLKTALICMVIGLSGLFFISDKVEIEEIKIEKITESDIGKDVKIIGIVEKVSDTDKVMFLEVGQQKIESISVVLFKDEDKILLKEGDIVELIGELDDYNGKMSIIANAVKVR